MSNTAVSTSRQSSSAPVPMFDIFHAECFQFPTKYIEVCARHGGWQGYEWYGRSPIKRVIRVVDVRTVAIWATCGECGKLIVEKERFHLFERVQVVSGQFAGTYGVIERIISDGENKGLWVKIEGEYGLCCLQSDQLTKA